MKKTAFVHCRVMPGGALNVFQDLVESQITVHKLRDVKIFTLFSDRKKIGNIHVQPVFPRRLNDLIIFFSARNIPFFSTVFNYRNRLPLYPLLMRLLSYQVNKQNSESIVISSFAVAKNLSFTKRSRSKSAA
jgi:hypothetical protein